jgi:hypothetical protein
LTLWREGSRNHERWNHPDGLAVTIPIHGGRKIGPPLFHKILRQLGLPWMSSSASDKVRLHDRRDPPGWDGHVAGATDPGPMDLTIGDHGGAIGVIAGIVP